MKSRLIAFTTALMAGTSLFAQLTVDENSNKKVETVINVQGPAETGELKRVKADEVSFMTGDLFTGKLVKFAPEGLVWEHADATAPITFKPANLNEINFGHIPVSLKRAGESDIVLTNGDRLFGLIEELNAEHLILDTWYAGKLKLEKVMIKSISSGGQVSKAIYEGPNNLEEWQVANRGSWQFKDGALINVQQYGGVGRDVKLPDRSNLEFDLAWKNRMNFQIHFYSDRVNNAGGNCYQLVFNSNYCYIQSYNNQEGSNQLASFNLNNLPNKFKVSIRTDKEKKSILVMIDGKLVKQVTDENNFAGRGTGLMFYSHQGEVKITNIKVTEWSGAVGETTTEANKTKDKDSIVFVNKDTVTGELKTIKEGKVQFETPFAPLTIPIDRIASISLSEDKYEKPRRNGQDVEIYFAENLGRLTINMESIVDSKISGASENFGTGSFDLRAFSKVVYNIYKEKKTKKEEDSW